MSTEIERKFMVGALPTAGVVSRMAIRQGYLAAEGSTVVRVRITDDESVITIKVDGDRGDSRTEVEVRIGEDDAEQLWAHTEGRRLTKVRHEFEVEGGVAEVDVYEGPLAGLLTAEVEFDSVAASDAFVPPTWFGRELTGDRAWSNAALARNGRPDGPAGEPPTGRDDVPA